MHVCYTALHYKLKTPRYFENKLYFESDLKKAINKLCLRAAKITHYRNTRSVYIKILPPDLDG